MYDNARGYAGSTYIAIGYQLQWGFTLFEPVDYKNINFTLPLAVNGTFCAFSTGYDVKGTTFLWHSMSHFNNINVGVTGFVFDSRYTFTGLGYLAICWQKQWGYYVESQNPTDYRYWSIPFTSHYITMATKTYYEPKEEAVPWLVGIDMQKFICGYGANFIGSSYVSCVGIGCQLQWGFTNNTGRPYITFPFKFSNVFTAISCICHNGSPSEANTVYNVSISGMNIGASGGGSGKYWCAFGVAQQQWGKILGDTVNLKIITFPVPFNESFGGVALFNGDPVAAAEYATITDVTNTNFKIYMYANNAGTGYANANIFYLFLGAQQQWGYSTVGSGAWALKFNGVYTAVVVGAPGFPAREFCGFTFDYTLTGWSFTAGYNSPISYIRPTTTAISLGY